MEPIIDDTLIDKQQLEDDIAQDEQDFKSDREFNAAVAEQQATTEEAGKNDKPGALQEAGTALVGGLAQAGEDVLSLPERLIDMASGEMGEQGEDYKPDWAFSTMLQADKFETTTWWGGLLKNATNFATLFIPVGGIAKGLGVGGKLASAAVKGNRAARVLNNPIVKGGLKGAAVDSVMSTSQGDNVSAEIIKRFPQAEAFLGPLATKDTDSPALKTFKNVVEGLGIGAIIDGVFVLAKGLRGVDDIAKRNDSVKAQTIEMGKAELESPEFGPHKNKPIATRTQGNPNSTATNPADVSRQLDNIDKEVLTPLPGSTDGPMTALQAARAASSANESEKVMQELAAAIYKDPEFKDKLKILKKDKSKLNEIFPLATERFRKLVGGRDWENIQVDEFIDSRAKNVTSSGLEFLDPIDVLTLDLVTGGLGKQIRDLAIAARETKGTVDIFEVGGIGDKLKTNLTTVLFETKKARFIVASKLKEFDARQKGGAAVEFDVGGLERGKNGEVLAGLDMSTRDQVEAYIDVVKTNPNSDLPEAFLEAMSMSNKIQNLSDFDAFMTAKLRGGTFKGEDIDAIWVKEMGAVMVHSILSGPKTPVRAIMGTGISAFTRSMSQALGAGLRLPLTSDVATAKASIASMNAMFNAIPEGFKVFKTRLNSYWSGDVATAATRYSDYARGDENWKAFGDWAETRGSQADKAAYRVANVGRELNNNKFLTYSTKLMAATDDAFRVIVARGRAKEKAMRSILERKGKGFDLNDVDMKDAEDLFYKDLLDENGNIDMTKDTFLKSVYEEATLTSSLEGFSAGIEQVFQRTPFMKPFFLFARTGVNGLALGLKNTPVFNMALKKQRAIFMGNADNLVGLKKYGINTMEELANEKALMAGRQAIGAGVTMMALNAYYSDRLRGNGPQNRQQRQLWKDSGWRPNEIKIGDAWFSTRFLEPWNTWLDFIADVHDHQQTMGEEWVEDRLKAASGVLGILIGGTASKSYLQGITQLTDIFSEDGRQLEKTLKNAANIANNTIPLAGLRNEIGKVITPYTRELSSSAFEAIRNRNLFAELATDKPLPIKYDILNGKPIRDDLFMVRMWNAVSPVHINFDNSPGRELLFNSNYDTRLSVMSSPDGVSLREVPEVRSLFMKALGDQNLEAQLNVLSRRKDVRASVEKMQDDIASGNVLFDDDKGYEHNRLIRLKFLDARRKAWASIQNNPQVRELVAENRQRQIRAQQSLDATSSIPATLILQNK